MNKLKKFTIIILTVLLLSAMFPIKANAALSRNQLWNKGAAAIGQGVYVGGSSYDKLPFHLRNYETYCIHHKGSFQSALYKVQEYVTINGREGTSYRSNGTAKSTNKYQANAILAYLLERGTWAKAGFIANYNDNGVYNTLNRTEKDLLNKYGDDMGDGDRKSISVRQIAIWKYMPTWVKSGNLIDSKWTFDYGNGHNKNLRDQADSFIKEAKKNVNKYNPYISTARTIESTSVRTLGPFKVNFRGKVSSVVAKDINGKNVSITLRRNNKTINAKDIESGTNFYIINNNNTSKKIRTVTVNVTGTQINARMWFLAKDGYFNKNEGQAVMIARTGHQTINLNKDITITYQKGSLTIKKRDGITKTKVLKAGFKIHTLEGWLSGTGTAKSPYKYNNSSKKATIYYTSPKTGNKKLNNLEYGKYTIYEVKAPSSYSLKKQSEYNKTKKWVVCGSNSITVKSPNPSRTVYNYKNNPPSKLSISGYVWEEQLPQKYANINTAYDSLYGNVDRLVSGVNVSLYKKGENEPIDVYTTKSDGKYIFSNIDVSLEDYYISFDYSDLTDEENRYIPVAFNAGDLNSIKTNSSKALANTILLEDEKAPTVATTYTGKDAQSLAKYGFGANGNIYKALFNRNTKTLENINLGLKKLEKPKFDISQRLEYIKIKIKGYTYTYYYGNTTRKIIKDGPTVSTQNATEIDAYSKPIYPSDIQYKSEDSKDELKVYVVYKIDIKNSTNTTINELYKEEKLIITELANKFDSNRYILETNYDVDKNDVVRKEFANWKKVDNSKVNAETEEETANISQSALYTGTKFSSGLAKNNQLSTYIQFKVDDDAIREILNHPEGIIESYPTKSIATGYHEYKRDEYMWTKDGKEVSDLKVSDNNHKTGEDVEDDNAPYLIFNLSEKERTISGKVFEDSIDTNIYNNRKEKLGDGIFKEGEKGVGGVKVELLDIGNELTLSHLYPVSKDALNYNDSTDNSIGDDDGSSDNDNEITGGSTESFNSGDSGENKYIIPAVTTTDENGNFSLVGVVPGRYYLRFTYGNGDYRITDVEGRILTQGKLSSKINGQENAINAKDYKSTIISSQIVKNALEYKEENTSTMNSKQKAAYEEELREKTYTWYKNKELNRQNAKEKYSVGIDEKDLRISVNNGTAENMKALTPQVSITIENNNTNYSYEENTTTNVTQSNLIDSSLEELSNDITVKVINDQYKHVKYLFGGFYFGIIEQPKTDIEIEKLITNVKLTHSQGNVLFDGNPENTETLSGVSVSDLDDKQNGGSSYVRAEIAEDSIYSTNLEITYEVKITNKSELNYYNDEYYYYGDSKDKTKEVTLTPTKVTDYLDKSLTYDEVKSNKERIVDKGITKNPIIVDGERITAQEFNLTGWKKLYTSLITNRKNEQPTTDKVILVANRKLSRKDEDMEIVSRAVVTEVENSTSGTDPEQMVDLIKKPEQINASSKATLTITPPTGEVLNNLRVYAIIGMISLVLISAGIIVIKKKIV